MSPLEHLGKYIQYDLGIDNIAQLVGYNHECESYIVKVGENKGHDCNKTRRSRTITWFEDKYARDNYSDMDLWNLPSNEELKFVPAPKSKVNSNNLFNIDEL